MKFDFISGRVASVPETAGTRFEAQFFPEPIEKGVLRRARIRTLFTPREGDEAVVLKHVEQLARISPPLTA